jgi:Radial spokehead-like protein
MLAVEAGQEGAYITRNYGERQQFNLQGKDEGKTGSYEIVAIQSQQWPGFFTIVNIYKQRWSCLYLGLGLKANQKFIPDKPRDFNKEPNDLTETKEVGSFSDKSLTINRRWRLQTIQTETQQMVMLQWQATQTTTRKACKQHKQQ